MGKELFDLNIDSLNLLIGLQKGSRLLFPYSKYFESFSFKLFSIEQSIRASEVGPVKPEIIFVSSQISNTLLVETTEAPVDKKILSNQFERYCKIEKDKLSLIGGIPNRTLNSFDILFIVKKENGKEYLDHINSKKYNFPLYTFTLNADNYELRLIENHFSNMDVNKFFSAGITIKRLPRFIKYDLANIDKHNKEMISGISQCLLKLILRKRKNDYILLSEIAEDLFSKELWQALAKDKKENIINLVSHFIRLFIRKKPFVKTKWFLKLDSQIQLLIDDKNKENEIRELRKVLSKFCEEFIDPFPFSQLELEFRNEST